jgi:hypothetical protein
MLVIRLVFAVATLALLSSIPAAGQAPKLSPQQLNPPTVSVNKPIAVPNKLIIVPKTPTASLAKSKVDSPNLNKPIAAAPRGTIAFQRPVGNRNLKSRTIPDDGGTSPGAYFGHQEEAPGPNIVYPPCPGGAPRSGLSANC